MALKGTFSGMFSNVASKMFASRKTQGARGEIRTEEPLSFFFLRRRGVVLVAMLLLLLLTVGLVAVGIVLRYSGLITG